MLNYDSPSVDYQDPESYINLVSFVILYYDYGLTLSMEVERFWTFQSFTWASFFFFLNRYLSVVGHIPVIVEFFWTTPNPASKFKLYLIKAVFFISSCRYLQSYHQYFVLVVQLVVGALLILRTYALYDRKRSALIILITAATAVVVFGCWAVTSSSRPQISPQDIPEVGCYTKLTRDEGIRLGAAWSGLLLFDTLVFIMTLYKSVSSEWGGNTTLFKILLRDGCLYYAVMVLTNLCNIVMFFIAPLGLRGFLATFTNILSSTLISRLVLNLRDPSLRQRRRSRSSTSRTRWQEQAETSRPTVSTVFTPETTQDLAW